MSFWNSCLNNKRTAEMVSVSMAKYKSFNIHLNLIQSANVHLGSDPPLLPKRSVGWALRPFA